jgi:predicted kinase
MILYIYDIKIKKKEDDVMSKLNLRPKLFFMIGLPASGKSYHSQEIAKTHNAIIVSSDSIREEVLGDINDQSNQWYVFQIVHDRIKSNLLNGNNVVYDATNISSKRRMEFLRQINNIDCEKIAVLILTPYDKCLEQNKNRDRNVPVDVIKRMYLNFDVPYYFEGWDKIDIKYEINDLKKYSIDKIFERLDIINQDSPYHTLTVGQHCRKAKDYIIQKHGVNYDVVFATFLHDIGKEFTKTFINHKGETTDIAHFYNHENVSAYDGILIFLEMISKLIPEYDYENYQNNILQILHISQLIKFHMRLHNTNTEKSKQKLINLVGEDFYNELMMVHEADKYAH